MNVYREAIVPVDNNSDPVNLTFRPLTREDLPMLSGWLAAPHVHQWSKQDPDPAAVEAKFGPEVDGAEPTELFVRSV